MHHTVPLSLSLQDSSSAESKLEEVAFVLPWLSLAGKVREHLSRILYQCSVC